MILLLGGTSDSLELANELHRITPHLIVSTATDYGATLAHDKFKGRIISGKMDEKELRAFCEAHRVEHIVDGTHPYAHLISENAMKVCEGTGMTYWRYERPSTRHTSEVIVCATYEEAGRYINVRTGNVLVTTGSRYLEDLIGCVEHRSRLYVRVLPSVEHLTKLRALHLLPRQIIAMQGPFSLEMNRAMLEHTQARYLITKESGEVGKTEEKIQAAIEWGAEVIVIQRPPITYDNSYDTLASLIECIKKQL